MGLYRRRDSKFYWVKLKVNGQKIYKSTGTSNKKLAEKTYAKMLLDTDEDKWFESQAKRKTLKEMIERYEKEYTNNKSYYQKARDKSIFKHLKTFFGETCTLGGIESSIGGYEMYRKSKGVKAGTILKELGLFRRMFTIARKQWKWKMSNPVSEIELPKVNNKRIRYLTQDEYQRLVSVLEKVDKVWLKPFVIVALETGLRLSNLCNLLWSEVNMFSRMIVIDAEKMKNQDYIGIPLSDRVHETFRELQKVRCLSGHVFHDNGKKLYPVKVQRAFREVLKSAEISDFRFHDLRHSFASLLIQSGVDIYSVQKLLGHKDNRMTQRYAHLSVENLRRAISILNQQNGYVLVTFSQGENVKTVANP